MLPYLDWVCSSSHSTHNGIRKSSRGFVGNDEAGLSAREMPQIMSGIILTISDHLKKFGMVKKFDKLFHINSVKVNDFTG